MSLRRMMSSRALLGLLLVICLVIATALYMPAASAATWYSKAAFNAGTYNLGSTNTGIVKVEFDLTPLQTGIDGVVGYGDTSTVMDAFTKFAAIFRMDPTNVFQVMNGTAYAADASVSYAANTSYHIKMIIDLVGKKYDAWVGTTKIATNYAFRTSAPLTDDLGQVCLKTTADNLFKVDNHTVVWSGNYSQTTFSASSIFSLGASNTGTQSVEFDVTPAATGLDAVVGYADTSTNVTTYADNAMLIKLDTDNTIKVYNGTTGTYGADATVSYAANTSYHIKMVTNLTTKKYDVFVGSTQIASQYAFRTSAPVTDDLGKVCFVSSIPNTNNNIKVINHTITPVVAWYSQTTFNASDIFSLGTTNTGIRAAEFDVTPAGSGLDGVIAYVDTSTNPAAYADCPMLIKLDTDNIFKVYNGAISNYGTDNSVYYSTNSSYHIKMVTNLSTKKYDVYVNGVKIANQYSFRTSAPTTDDLGKVCLVSSIPATNNNLMVQNHTVYATTMPTSTPPPTGTIDLVGDFETGNWSQWNGGLLAKDPAYQLTIVTSPKRSGNYAAKYIVRPGDQYPGTSGERAEASMWMYDRETINDVWYYGWSNYFPTGFQTHTQGGAIMQWHANTNYSMPVALAATTNEIHTSINSGNIDGGYPLEYERKTTIISNLQKGVWNDFIVAIKFRPDYTGYVKVWHRIYGQGEFTLISDQQNIPTLQWANNINEFHSGFAIPYGSGWTSGCWIQAGFYRAADATRTNTIYQDNFCRGTTYDVVRARMN